MSIVRGEDGIWGKRGRMSMGVYIRGMEMPKSCCDCPLAGDFHCNLMPSIPTLCKEYDIAVQNGKRLNNCPLVEIPSHGRLIDADALMNSLPMEYPSSVMAINNAPTIIEAEEDSDD